MLHKKLQNAYNKLTNWCDENQVEFDIVCDEDDIQGYMVPHQYDISNIINGIALDEGLFCREHQTRSGVIYALSLLSISESMLSAMVPQIDQSRLIRRLDLAFNNNMIECNMPPKKSSYKSNQSIGRKLSRRLKEESVYLPISSAVSEALDGIAAEHQPSDILRQFSSALHELGLVDSLRAAGVINRLSRDKQVISFFAGDEYGRNREIASYELAELAESNAMENAIKDLADIARMRAPGTTDREIERVKDWEQQVRNIAKQHSPDQLQQQEMGMQ